MLLIIPGDNVFMLVLRFWRNKNNNTKLRIIFHKYPFIVKKDPEMRSIL